MTWWREALLWTELKHAQFLHIILSESVHEYFSLVLQHLHIVFRDEAPLSVQLPLQPARLSRLDHCKRGRGVSEGRYRQRAWRWGTDRGSNPCACETVNSNRRLQRFRLTLCYKCFGSPSNSEEPNLGDKKGALTDNDDRNVRQRVSNLCFLRILKKNKHD